MEVKSFDTILTGLCDTFDSLISPKTIARSNTNIIYLVFKAIAKGYEVINNVCVSLNNKFDPSSCSEEDLESVASLVGTERLKGTASGLEITVTNNGEETAELQSGFYYYAFDDDTIFKFEVLAESETIPYVTVTAGSSVSYFAFSEDVDGNALLGSYAVTEQSDITVTTDKVLSSDFTFSCSDNTELLGESSETNSAFRQRILTETTLQDSIVELQTKLKSMPYIYDCQVIFNDTLTEKTIDDVTIPPYYMVIFYSGALRSEIAQVVAEKSIFPTVNVDGESQLTMYESDSFVDGYYPVYVTPFREYTYSVKVNFTYNSTYQTKATAAESISTLLYSELRGHKHFDYIKEADIYDALSSLGVASVEILNVDLYDTDGNEVSYISIPKSRIPYLLSISFDD